MRTTVNYHTDLTESDKMAVDFAINKQAIKEKKDENLKDILKAAWKQEGSPFQGQPFDPSVINNIKS